MKIKLFIAVLSISGLFGEKLFAEQATTLKGFLDGVNGAGAAVGWAIDTAKQSSILEVEFYVDEQKGPNKEILSGTVKADKVREGFEKAGYTGNHGFDFVIPAKYKDGKQRRLHAYAVSKGTSKTYYELSGSPTTLMVVPAKK